MLKLKLLYFGHLMKRTDSLGKTLLLGKIEEIRSSHSFIQQTFTEYLLNGKLWGQRCPEGLC